MLSGKITDGSSIPSLTRYQVSPAATTLSDVTPARSVTTRDYQVATRWRLGWSRREHLVCDTRQLFCICFSETLLTQQQTQPRPSHVDRHFLRFQESLFFKLGLLARERRLARDTRILSPAGDIVEQLLVFGRDEQTHCHLIQPVICIHI